MIKHLVCLLFLFFASASYSHDLFSETELCELMLLTGIKCEKDPAKIVEITQKHWLRQAGKERWEIAETFESKRSEILALMAKLGFVNAVKAEKKKYDYALVLGALSSTMKKRLDFLVKQWEAGLEFKEIFFLVGERRRDPVMESEDILFAENAYLNFPKDWTHPKVLPDTETEIAKMIYNHASLPKGFRKIPMTFINSPMKFKNGKSLRPTTLDTIHSLFEQAKIKKGASFLAISDQPYVPYQDAVLRGTPLASGLLETVGYAASKDTKVSVYLDSLARTLYNQLANRKSKQLIKK